jgi:hypothetical protein
MALAFHLLYQLPLHPQPTFYLLGWSLLLPETSYHLPVPPSTFTPSVLHLEFLFFLKTLQDFQFPGSLSF